MVLIEIYPVKFGGDIFIKYLDLLEEYLKIYSEEFVKTEKIDFEDPECGGLVSDYFLYSSEYPNILRKSFLITMYSYLEHELINTCEFKKESESLQLDINDLNGGVLERAKKYLKLIGKDISSCKSWSEINNIKAIRNCIVHSDGVLTSEKHKHIRNYIKKRQDIRVEGDAIFLTADYCRHAINTFSDFEFEFKYG